ncbi:hypothetical protein POJ06DRAFT_252258 [Lipomyces tetrasporus]|uniref:Glycosyl transferase CAP10 domain-containing protein n=1 Tax=Lipomyces tetrasporus TaxID=54092 RepID=A0AAD7VRQ4_9ASCO|nr:uncharacterized protein POJ06DRAFT_252258 [Lipomyces tetrasporus]KAJ8100282.1 hypothetical protein POJ06DRAFT_252258 [Lipomyces tetrasporus]
MVSLYRSAPFLTLVASLLSVISSFVIPYSRYLFSASFSWASFCLATFLPIDRLLLTNDNFQKYRRIDVVICSTCIVLSTVCASLLGERGNGLSSVLIPLLVHILRFQYMTHPVAGGADDSLHEHEKNITYGTTKVDMSTLVFITITSFLALAPNYPGASQLVFGMCSSIFAATYLSISDITIPLTRTVLREISAYTCLGLLLMSLLLDGWAGWSELGTSDGLATMIFVWSLFSAIKNIIIMVLIQQLSPINASFVDLIGNLSTTLYYHTAWKVASMCISYMAIATTLLPSHIGDKRIKYLSIRMSKMIILVIALFLLCFGVFMAAKPRIGGSSQRVIVSNVGGRDSWNTTIHPISYLIESHTAKFEDFMSRQTATYPEAVKEYRRRYNLNPPPNFDKWYAFATEKKAAVLDDYDTIHHNLHPFWGLSPATIRQSVRDALANPDSFLLGLYIRNGVIANVTGAKGQWFDETLTEIISGFVQFLPDMDLAFNLLDSPRVVMPHADLAALLDHQQKSGTKNEFTMMPSEELDAPVVQGSATSDTVFESFSQQSSWGHAKLSCAPDSPLKTTHIDRVNQYALSIGFIKNSTAALDICLSPSYKRQHGVFVRPEFFSIVSDPVPIFSQSKLSSFGDILYPSPSYFAERAPYDHTHDMPWAEKSATMFWRGAASGVHSRAGTWRQGHRQRTVSYFSSFAENCTMLMDLSELEKLGKQLGTSDLLGWFEGRLADVAGDSHSHELHESIIQKRDVHAKIKDNAAEKLESKDTRKARDEKGPADDDHDPEADQADHEFYSEMSKKQMANDQNTESQFAEHSVPKGTFEGYIDLKFSKYQQCDNDDCREQKQTLGAVAPSSNFQDTWKYKYLLDMDGNGHSARYYAFLKSRSLVVKQTLFKEWHDERLVPWVHYVPLSVGLKEGFEILRFLLENDISANYIADRSRRWSAKALRKEDMEVYFFRLLLEYGRLVDDNRDIIGCI